MHRIHLFTLLALFFAGTYVYAEVSKDRMYTNEDLDKSWRESEPDKQPEHNTIIDRNRVRKKSNEKSTQYKWCNRGTKMHNRVDKAKSNLEAAEKKFKDDESKQCIRKKKPCRPPSNKKVLQARTHLLKAEHELRDLEQQAHIRGIPPGWLICQFSY